MISVPEVADIAAIKRGKASFMKVAISIPEVVADAELKKKTPADVVTDLIVIFVWKLLRLLPRIKKKKHLLMQLQSAAIFVAKVDADTAAIERRKIFANVTI